MITTRRCCEATSCDELLQAHQLVEAIIHASSEQGKTYYLALLVTAMVIRPAALWPSAACPVPAEVLERKGRSRFQILV
jgi:hypothetical protein